MCEKGFTKYNMVFDSHVTVFNIDDIYGDT